MLETEEVIKFINQEFINYVLTYINDYTYETVNIIGYIVYHSSDEYNDNFVNFSLISTIQNFNHEMIVSFKIGAEHEVGNKKFPLEVILIKD